ncbi:MAG: RagB/SusD family nutrient uptake outer membrane protein, partial [Chitinophagaceae bacterium]
ATQDALETTHRAAYATAANMLVNNSIYTLSLEEFPTDILTQSGDSPEADIAQYRNFMLTPFSNFLTTNYDPPYQTIRNANIILENIDRVNISDQQKAIYRAECRFLRATSYYKLYFFFGPTPLRKSTSDPINMAKATDEQMKTFIETELFASITDLPLQGKEASYGRAHKAAAQAFLTKFYLQTKQWQKAADMAKVIINLNYYSLFPNYKDLFKVENERNSEYIWIRPAKASADRRNSNGWMSVSFPLNFAREPLSGLTYLVTWANFPNEFRILDGFYNSFDTTDTRRSLIISSYIDNQGKTISLLNADNTRSFKYWPDPQGAGASHGNDVPEIRYADILLARAEALNELTGPSQESIDLINQVRSRAKVKPFVLAELATKEKLRDQLLNERGWEFYSEGQRRMDLIRMGKYISSALARGKTSAKAFHVLFPIPQVAINANPLLVQNDGY